MDRAAARRASVAAARGGWARSVPLWRWRGLAGPDRNRGLDSGGESRTGCCGLRRNTPVWGTREFGIVGVFWDFGLRCPLCEVRVQGCFWTRSPCACSCRTCAGLLRVTPDGVALMRCA